MLRPSTLLMAAFVLLAGIGVAQAGPRGRAAHHAAHHARATHRAERWLDRHTPDVVVNWRLRHPHAAIVVVDGFSVPSIAGRWTITMKDARGHFETVTMSGSTPNEAVARAKLSFQATGHAACGIITVTLLEWAGE